jgi:hypothetical protein
MVVIGRTNSPVHLGSACFPFRRIPDLRHLLTQRRRGQSGQSSDPAIAGGHGKLAEREIKRVREMLLFVCMQSIHVVSGTASSTKAKKPKRARKPANAGNVDSKYATEEIAAYIIIRDGLLADAERRPTSESLRCAAIANDFVESCLEPARSPYEAQFLPQLDAASERQRCENVKLRIAELSAK